MNIKFSTSKLRKIISIVSRFTSSKPQSDIDSNIFIKIINEKIFFKAFDFISGIEIEERVDNDTEDALTIHSNILKGVVTSLPFDGDVEIEKSGKNINLKTKTSKVKIVTTEIDGDIEIPNIKEVDGTVRMKREHLLDGFKSVSYAVSKSIIKPEFSGVYMYKKEGIIHFVATDTFRLVERRYTGVEGSDIQVIIQNESVQKIINFLDLIEDEFVDIVYGSEGVVFKTKGVRVFVKTIDKQFPNYRELIPKEHFSKVIVLKEEILNSLKKTNFIKNKYSEVILRVENGKLRLDVGDSDAGSFEDEIMAKTEGGGAQSGYNYRYLQEAIQNINSEQIVFEFNENNLKPVVLRKPKEDNITALIMPISK